MFAAPAYNALAVDSTSTLEGWPRLSHKTGAILLFKYLISKYHAWNPRPGRRATWVFTCRPKQTCARHRSPRHNPASNGVQVDGFFFRIAACRCAWPPAATLRTPYSICNGSQSSRAVQPAVSSRPIITSMIGQCAWIALGTPRPCAADIRSSRLVMTRSMHD